MADSKLRIGYWCIRALGNAIRYVLEYSGIEYDERTYNLGKNFDTRDDWLNEKFQLGLAFPNIPYLIEGDVKITQSLAIMRYLGRKSGLYPKTKEEEWRVDLAEQQINDLMWACNGLCYNKGYSEDMKNKFMSEFMGIKCEQLDKFLGDTKFFGGDQLTYVDFLAYEMFDQHRVLWPEYEKMYHKHPKVEAFLKRMEALPNLAKFLNSERCIKWPMWSEGAMYGGIKMAAPRPPVKY